MKQFLCQIGGLFVLSFFISLTSYAQKREYGFCVGAMTYTGEILPTYTISANLPAASVYFKHNFNYATALRYNLTYGLISAKDADYARDVFAENRGASIDISLVELSLMYEYNFLDFRDPRQRAFLSPYLVAGIGGAFIISSGNTNIGDNNLQLILPIGVGVKYQITRKWTLAIEAIVKATFTDYLDNISGDNQDVKNYNFGSPHQNDTYYFVGLRVGYSIWTIDCPFDAY